MGMEEKKGFTLQMAVIDAVPVLLFGGSCLLIASVFKSLLFLIGACCCLIAGIGKVTWKILLAVKQKDIHLLSRQFRYLLPLGFLCMLLAVFINHKMIQMEVILHVVISVPTILFFTLGIAGSLLMGILAWKLEESIRANWQEQIINTIAQLCLFLGILSAVMFH